MTQTTAQPTIRLIASDIDGTLLNSKLQLSPRNKAALQAALAEGVQFVLATGKSRGAGAFITNQLGLNSHGIFMQGLIVYDGDGNILWQQTLDPDAARKAITYAEERGFSLIAYSSSRIMIHERDEMLIAGIGRYHEPDPEIVGPLQDLLPHTPLNKIMVIGEPKAITQLRGELQALVGDSLRLMQAGLPQMLEILPLGGSKGAALRVLIDLLGIPAEQVMAMGDAENDMEMLELAGIGVAVGNADPKLKAIAQAVVATNDEDGVAEAIERFVLHRKVEVPAGEPPMPTPDEPAPETLHTPSTSEKSQ
jgi:Cof subfamily protein (haloacid dehalogenase superfamily)